MTVSIYYKDKVVKKNLNLKKIMRRLNNLVTLFCAIFAFFFGCFLSKGFLNNNIEKCHHTSNYNSIEEEPQDIFLMVAIFTAPNYFERREVIRNTWLQYAIPTPSELFPQEHVYIPEYDRDGFLMQESISQQNSSLRLYSKWLAKSKNDIDTAANYRIKSVFVIGTKGLIPSVIVKLRQEQQINNDLLLLDDLEDAYLNLTAKLLLSIEKFTTQYNFNYLLKADDDSFIKLDLIKNELISYHKKLLKKSSQYSNELPLPELYWGYFNGGTKIKSQGKWREIHYNICERYGPYAVGGGYIISRNIAEYIAANSKILSSYVSEDVSMGTWLSPLKNIYRRHDVRFDTSYMARECKKYHLILHKRSTVQMKELFEKELCKLEGKIKSVKRPLEYFYDWEKPLDKCCGNFVTKI